MIRALIVDDEPPARRRIKELLEASSDFDVIGECGDGAAGIVAIRQHRPDLLFLDVQMPEVDGFEVLEQIGASEMPVTIFVTAFDQYAIRAFEACALDYLLKPFSDERFLTAVDRARESLRSRDQALLVERLARILNRNDPRREPFPERILVKTGARSVLVEVATIDWIEAAGVYVRLHTKGRTFVHRESLGALSARLDPRRFVRIHRSSVVAIRRIREIAQQAHGQFHVVLDDDTRLKLSRGYREQLEARLGHRL